jgi:3-oxoacyl-[acyl-carrier protein] reductase
MRLKNKIALITGATGVIGSAIARFFINDGCHVILVGRSAEAVERLKKSLDSDAQVDGYVADMAKLTSVQSLMAEVQKKYEYLDILVTAAGVYGEIGSLEQCDPAKWTEAAEVNLFGTVWCVQTAIPLLKKSRRGKIITFAGGGEGALPNFTAYVSSKGAILRFVETAAKELETQNIEINAVSPGLINSGLVQDLINAGEEKVGKEKYQEALAQVAGKVDTVSPDRAASLAVFLASEESDGLSGKNISAVWDKWEEIPNHLEEIKKSDVYNWRRIKPKDRGYEW